ncbi:DMT family transporter [Sandaracinobacteroides saxicola]|uniref:DMT family transporter n=1 Tax=Sandaracinobacteroides saxicola TaxID=2759707 RepID=A0A7G5IHR1_9SPHN|nr:DMT family transporter [Sandaracinobacteroides saxicola]QMW22903.1 DMT family transporter [Sandaracinobacteroides saxicola]
MLASLPPHIRGPLWMVVACFAFAGLWVLIRLISEELHPFAVVVWRNFMGLLWLAPMLLLTPGLLRMERFLGHVRRASSGIIATFATFYAVANAPLATVLSINYTAPLFATIGAVLFLGERIHRTRIIALLVGFAGMLLVLRPGAAALDLPIIAAIVSALATAFSMVAIKALTGQDDPRAVAAWSFILTTPVSFLLAIPVWTWPQPHLWPLLVALGACAAAGQLALAQAFAAADAGAVMPYDFVRFGLITLAGILLFRERYDVFTLAGGAIILSATIFLAVREREVKSRNATASSPDT